MSTPMMTQSNLVGTCVSVEDIPIDNDETADKILETVENILKEAYPSESGNITDQAYRIRNNLN